MQGSWNRDRHKLREPATSYDPDQETSWWSRFCCIWGLFEMFTCCALGGVLAAACISAILLISAGRG